MPKSKKPRKKFNGGIKPPSGKKAIVQQTRVEQHQLKHRVEQMATSIVGLQKQVDVTRLGIVAVNQLMSRDEWSKELNKTRQFIFGLVAFLKDKYPGILSEAHRHIKNSNFDEIEEYIGKFDVKIGYSLEEFKEMCNRGAASILNDRPTQIEDEQGSEEEAQKKFADFMARVDQKSQLDQEFVGDLRNAISTEFVEPVPTAPGEPGHYNNDPSPDPDGEHLIIKDPNVEKTCEMCGDPMVRSTFNKMSDYSWNQKVACSDKCKRQLKALRNKK